MAGNVQEVVQDWYHEGYDGAPVDGSAWEDPKTGLRVSRGGHWSGSRMSLRSSRRDVFAAEGSSEVFGFRCVRSVP
jgi:formylglycine-generating enzyme required for sulfatase activity